MYGSLGIFADGNYRIYFNSSDNLNNQEIRQIYDFYLDNTGPETQLEIGFPKIRNQPTDIWNVSGSTTFNLTSVEIVGSGPDQTSITYRVTNVSSAAVVISDTIGTTIDLSALPDGEYLIEYWSRDNLSILGITNSTNVFVDNTPPTMQIFFDVPKFRVLPTDPWFITSDTDISFTATDGLGVGVELMEFRIQGPGGDSGWQTYSVPTDLNAWGLTTDGTYTIDYRVRDFLGNTRAYTVDIVLDNAPPNTTLRNGQSIGDPLFDVIDVPGLPRHQAQPGDIWNMTDNSRFQFRASDGGTSGVASIAYRILDEFDTPITGWIVSAPGATLFANQNFLPLGFVDGYYTIEYNSTDWLGNVEPPNFFDLYLDNTPPVTTFNITSPQFRFNITSDLLNVTFDTPITLFADDGPGSGWFLSQYWIEVHPTDGGNFTSLHQTYNMSYFTIGDLVAAAGAPRTDGEYTIFFHSVDHLPDPTSFFLPSRNLEDPPGNFTIIVDGTAPQMNVIFNDPQFRFNVTADLLNITSLTPINLIAIDPHVGVQAIEFKIEYPSGNTTVIRVDAPTVGSNFTVTIDLLTEIGFLEDGTYTISFRGIDILDNGASVFDNFTTVTVIVDNTPPDVSRVFLDTSYDNGTSLFIPSSTSIDFTIFDLGLPPVGVDPTSSFIVDLTTGTTWNFTNLSAVISLLLEGRHDIAVIGFDLLNNSISIPFEIIVDDTPPTSTIDVNGGTPLENGSDKNNAIDVSLTDAITIAPADGGVVPSGTAESWYEIRAENGTIEVPLTMWDGSDIFLPGFWYHTVTFYSIDNVGNIEPGVTLWFFIEGDLIPPLPPSLIISASGINVSLEWLPSADPESQDVTYYLIYESLTRTGFDFTTPSFNTSIDMMPGELNPDPLRTTLRRPGILSSTDKVYYAIRAVDERYNVGNVSVFGGVEVITVHRGWNVFSLPLQPYEPELASSFLSRPELYDEFGDSIFKYDDIDQKWEGLPAGMPPGSADFTLMLGESYNLYVTEIKTDLLFTGFTATAIRMVEPPVSIDPAFELSLDVQLSDPDTLTVSWVDAGADSYNIYVGTSRNGSGSLHDYTILPALSSVGTTATIDMSGLGPQTYILVTAAIGSDEVASTYALGVERFTHTREWGSLAPSVMPTETTTINDHLERIQSPRSVTMYYYDATTSEWVGHPQGMPADINNVAVGPGDGMMIATGIDTVGFSFIGR